SLVHHGVRKPLLNTWLTHGRARHWQPSTVSRSLWTPSTEHVTRMLLVERAKVDMQLHQKLHRLRPTESRLQPISSDKFGTFFPHDRDTCLMTCDAPACTVGRAVRRSPMRRLPFQDALPHGVRSPNKTTNEGVEVVSETSAAYRPPSGAPIDPGTVRRSLRAAAGVALLGGLTFFAGVSRPVVFE